MGRARSKSLRPDFESFQKYLPYAVALEVSGDWIECAELTGSYTGILRTGSGAELFNSKDDLQNFLCSVGGAFGFSKGEGGYTGGKSYGYDGELL